MLQINDNFLRLQGNYLFAQTAEKIKAYQDANPSAPVIKMGIGDVTLPLVPAVLEAMHKAVDDMGEGKSFRGYGPDYGYDFLIDAILENDFAARGVTLDRDEIFVSDGAKCDTGNFQELFSPHAAIALSDPVYPVYLDTNVMSGRAGAFDPDKGRYAKVVYLPCNADNGFCPALPEKAVDVIYLCYPNNPTGTTLTKAQLKTWVDYALENDALILFDAAYEAFIQEQDIPHSIYEIEGAKEVAVEFRSFSKTAGFTGVRCAYTVVPKAVMARDTKGHAVSLNSLWARRQATKFNGVSYITQRGAQAIYTADGKAQVNKIIRYYQENADILKASLTNAGYKVYGGVNAPYLWIKTKNGLTSWQFFDELLAKLNIAGTPGVGFGRCGEGYFRLTAFGSRENTVIAADRITKGSI